MDQKKNSGKIKVYPTQIKENSSESNDGDKDAGENEDDDDENESKSTSKLSDDMNEEYTKYGAHNYGNRMHP